MNIIEEHIYIDDLHYILEFDKPFFSFYLVNIPTRRQYIDYKKHPELILFRDDPIYEDIAINLPALKILRVMSKHIERLIYRYNINYWTFSATSMTPPCSTSNVKIGLIFNILPNAAADLVILPPLER